MIQEAIVCIIIVIAIVFLLFKLRKMFSKKGIDICASCNSSCSLKDIKAKNESDSCNNSKS